MLRRVRVIFAVIFWVAITLLFLDFTGTLHTYLGWLAKVQFLPAVLALNVGVIIALVVLTLLFGRLYCSVICPAGVFQDVVAKCNRKKNRFSYSKAVSWLRYGVLALFVVALVVGVNVVVSLLEPYSAYGRMVANLFAPLYKLGNNLFATIAERMDSYAFYQTDVWVKGAGAITIAVVTLLVLSVLAWRGGRTYCNTICPVGTVLGLLSKFSIFKVRFNEDKCNSCGLCARSCKASCIDAKSHTIDYSRCVSCFNCIGKCNRDALKFSLCKSKTETESKPQREVDTARRSMLMATGAVVATTVVKAQTTKVDGGLAYIEDKKIPNRQTSIVPAGAQSIRNFTQHCTACQLCVTVCPNGVLRPSNGLMNFMQPEVSYERGYCRPECTKCSEVCPAGAIKSISKEDKSSTQIGHAVFVYENCVVNRDAVECGNCARHCPVGAIQMVASVADDPASPKLPVVDEVRCIGCGACENLCPARPFSAIFVEGHQVHKTV